MFIGTRAALLQGAAPLPAPETKDGNLDTETKAAVEDIGKAWEEFKKKNDLRLDQLDKKGEDAVTKDELEKLNKAVDDGMASVKKQLDDLATKANLMHLSGTGEGADEAKAARMFGDLIGQKDYSVEDLTEYKSDLDRYLRRAEAKAATMSVASDPSGGYWVTPDTRGRMVKKIHESTPMRQLASVVVIGSDMLEGPIDNDEGDAAWVGETGTRSQTDTPQIGMWQIPVHELYAYPKVTQKLLEDSKINVEAWLADKSTSKFSRKENAAHLNGDGAQKPRGILNYDFVATADDTRPWGKFQYVKSGKSGAFADADPADKLIDLIFEVKAAYRQNADFLMARRTMAAVRKLKNGTGDYLVDLRLRDGALVESIFGFPVTDGEDMPAFSTANALGILFGDFAEAYTIVDRLGVSVVRDNITQPGFVKYHMRKRTGGGAVNFEAIKGFKFAA